MTAEFPDLECPAPLDGWIEPPNPTVAADYWVTRRDGDAAPGYGRDAGLPDIRKRYRWNGNGAWITGYYETIRGREVDLGCLHSNNGWRLEGPAE